MICFSQPLQVVFTSFPSSFVGTEPRREEARRHAAVVAISGVLIGVILISLATAATTLPAYVTPHSDLTVTQ